MVSIGHSQLICFHKHCSDRGSIPRPGKLFSSSFFYSPSSHCEMSSEAMLAERHLRFVYHTHLRVMTLPLLALLKTICVEGSCETCQLKDPLRSLFLVACSLIGLCCPHFLRIILSLTLLPAVSESPKSLTHTLLRRSQANSLRLTHPPQTHTTKAAISRIQSHTKTDTNLMPSKEIS